MPLPPNTIALGTGDQPKNFEGPQKVSAQHTPGDLWQHGDIWSTDVHISLALPPYGLSFLGPRAQLYKPSFPPPCAPHLASKILAPIKPDSLPLPEQLKVGGEKHTAMWCCVTWDWWPQTSTRPRYSTVLASFHSLFTFSLSGDQLTLFFFFRSCQSQLVTSTHFTQRVEVIRRELCYLPKLTTSPLSLTLHNYHHLFPGLAQ